MNHIAPPHEPLIREVPLSRLALAPENVRKTPADPQADAALKASIAAIDLLENLVVRPDEPDEDAAGDQRRALGQLVFADLAVEHQLIERRLHHRHRRRQLFQVDEPGAGIVGGRQEGRRRPAGAVGAVAPRDAAEIDGVEQERPDVDILAAGIGGDLLGDHRFCRAGRSPYQGRLAGLDQKREGGGEFARAQRIVGGNGVGHRRAPEWLDGGAGTLRAPGLRPAGSQTPAPSGVQACFRRRRQCWMRHPAGCLPGRALHRPADTPSKERKMDQWDRELAKAGIQMAGAAGKGMGNVMVAVIDGLIEKGVFSIEEVRDMLDRLEATVRRAEGEIEGDLAEEAEVAATMAIVDHRHSGGRGTSRTGLRRARDRAFMLGGRHGRPAPCRARRPLPRAGRRPRRRPRPKPDGLLPAGCTAAACAAGTERTGGRGRVAFRWESEALRDRCLSRAGLAGERPRVGGGRSGDLARAGRSRHCGERGMMGLRRGRCGGRHRVRGDRRIAGQGRGGADRGDGEDDGGMPGRGPGASGQALDVSVWPGGLEPVRTLLDRESLLALGDEPSAEDRTLRFAKDLTEAELDGSAFVRNALILLGEIGGEETVWTTNDGRLNKAGVARMRTLMSWPGMEATEQFRAGKSYYEQQVGELHLLRSVATVAGLIEPVGLWFKLTPLGQSMLEPGSRGALQALLFRQAFWHRDLSTFVSGRPRNLPGWWPQGDIGAVLWSISAVAADWQNAATLTALCTVPDDTMPTAAHWDPAATMFARHILDPLRWFGLVEYRGPEVSFDVQWRKTALFDRFLSFDVRFADGRTKGH